MISIIIKIKDQIISLNTLILHHNQYSGNNLFCKRLAYKTRKESNQFHMYGETMLQMQHL
jgi:hypothetical protein